jgi:hypothetical protein
MPKLLTSTRLLRGSIRGEGRDFTPSRKSKVPEKRVSFYFPTASSPAAPAPVSRRHYLGRTPTSYTIVSNRCSSATPGTVFDVFPFLSPTHITLHCSVGQSTVEIIVR